MYLIATNKRDLTSDFVVLELQRRKLPYIRLNTEDIPLARVIFNPKCNCWSLNTPSATFNLSDIKAAYFRRPGRPIPLDGLAPEAKQYCEGEWQACLQAIYWVLEDRWLNSPQSIALAENKIRQLALAAELGFDLPETIVTNDPDSAVEFSSKQPIIAKPLKNALIHAADAERVMFTSRVEITANTERSAIQVAPVILQREIEKSFDIRVTVVGEQVFAASIDSQAHPETQVDWRRSSEQNLEHLPHELPTKLAAKCVSLTKKLGLRFGAIDFVLDRAGKYWFLEINPNGQWGWIETRTGFPIAAAIVSELERVGA